MTLVYFQELFSYTHAMNERCIDALTLHEESVPARAHSLMCHILNAEQIWLDRIADRPPECEPWEAHPAENYAILNNRNRALSAEALRKDDVERMVSYANSVGQVFNNTVGDILFHIINHSTYHRAQIATLLRSAEVRPPSTDYIVYKRQ